LSAEEETVEGEAAEAAPAPAPEAIPAADAEATSALAQKCQELESQIEQLKGFKEELDNIKAQQLEAQNNEKRQALRDYAAKSGLDVESSEVSGLIQGMDYAGIFSQLTALNQQSESQVTGLFDDIKISSGPYGDLLQNV